jgi:predicted Zn-dependent protease
VLARFALAVVAVLVLAWIGVLLRDFTIGHDAAERSFFDARSSRAQRLDDRRRLEDAELLDPSSYWALAHASNLLRGGERRRAVAEAEALVRDEPENVAVWGLLGNATRVSDPARAAEAAARRDQLNPLGSR